MLFFIDSLDVRGLREFIDDLAGHIRLGGYRWYAAQRLMVLERDLVLRAEDV